MTPNEFYVKYNGKAVDVDGYYGAQCWDLFAKYMQELGYQPIGCQPSGYVHSIYDNRANNGILNYCDEVPINRMEDGDIAIWGICSFAPYSHIAIFRLDNKNNTGVFFEQNNAGRMYANQANEKYSGLIGAFRPKCFSQKPAPAVIHYIGYTVHQQNKGWLVETFDGDAGGFTGQSLRLEAFKLRTIRGGTVEYVKAHIQDKGWITYDHPGADTVIGSVGEGLAIEDLIIKLDGYEYRVHEQDIGWTSWTDCDGLASLGSTGQHKRLEAIQIRKKA